MIDVHAPRPLSRLHPARPLSRLHAARPLPLPMIRPSRPRIRLPRGAALVAWTCLPLFAAQLLLLSVMLAQ